MRQGKGGKAKVVNVMTEVLCGFTDEVLCKSESCSSYLNA